MRALTRLAVSFAVLACAARAQATDYWVSNAGSNANDGLTPGTAWATLVYAADQVAAGDTVHVQPGNYQGFYLDTGGTAGNPITFKAEGAVSITADNPTTDDGINIEDADHVVIDGFTVNGRTRAGIRAALSDFVTVRNNSCGNNGRWGIFTGHTDDFTVENNETYGSVLEHGIYVSNSSDRPIVRGNLIYGNRGNGIHLNGDLSQGGHGLIHDALIEDNVIYDNGTGGGSGINGDGLTSSIIRNNLLYDNHASGISLYRIDASDGAKDNLVVNNTIINDTMINPTNARWCINISDGSTGNTVRNNILYNYHSFRGVITLDAASLSGFSSDCNSLMNRFSIDGGDTVIDFADWQAEGYDANSFLAVPSDHFVAPGSDFHLLLASPAVDEGTATGAPNVDLDGNPRPVGMGFDMGAYELQLVDCGDGDADPGEQCGEPGLVCSDPCTSCSQCICAVQEICGDALVCGAEECEDDGDCAVGQTCNGCACENAPVCTSGIDIDKPRVALRVSAPKLLIKGSAVIPLPWTGVDPPANGVRFVVDHPSASESVDVTVPGGAAWSANGAGTRWLYKDPSGSIDGITRIVIRDESSKQPGQLRFLVKGPGPSPLDLPPDDAVRLHAILGAPGECASREFAGPSGARPRCSGDSAKLDCR
jgi:hypothetical protein